MNEPDDVPAIAEGDINGTMTFTVSLIDFPNGMRGIAPFVPEGSTCLPMTCEDAANLLAAVAACIRTATEYNQARAAGAVGRMQ